MRNLKRITALFLAAILLFCAASCGKTAQPESAPANTAPEPAQVTFSEAPASVRKSETVYANLDNSGAVQSVHVTDWLHTDRGGVAVADKSDLQGIADIKGAVVPMQNGTELTWHMPATDLYYKGTSEKKLPVNFTIEYRLNGKKLSPEKIAGKSGKAEIRVQMKNTCAQDGVYLPVLAAGLILLPEGVFSGVQVQNGLAIGDGAKEIAVGIGLPGMAESLHLREDAKLGSIEIADSFTITADVENFALDNLYFAVLPLCSMDLTTLIPGSSEEAEQFFHQIETLLQAIGDLDVDQLLDALSAERVNDIAEMLTSAISVYRRNEALLQVLSKYMTAENLENISKLLASLQDPKTVEMLEKLNNPLIKNLLSGMPELLESIQALTPTLNALQEDLQDPEVKQALDAMPETLETLSAMQETLDKNSEWMDLLGNLANEHVLAALQAFSASRDAQTLLTDLAENADSLLPDLQKYIAFGQSYGLYTDAADDMDISLLFIYMTPSLHAEVEKASEPATESLPWYKKIFS